MQVTVWRAATMRSAREGLYRRLIDASHREPDGAPLILLVPEQMTFAVERALVRRGLRGSTRLWVVSFTRLAWRVFQEAGGLARRPVTAIGELLLVAEAALRRREELGPFARTADRIGTLERLSAFLRELRRYGTPPEALRAAAQALASDPALQEKLAAAATVYADVDRALQSRYLAAEDALRGLAKRLSAPDPAKRPAWVAEAEVFVDGFLSFTPEELAVLDGLMARTRSVAFLFPDLRAAAEVADPAARSVLRALGALYGDVERGLDGPVARTVAELERLAGRRGVPFQLAPAPDSAPGSAPAAGAAHGGAAGAARGEAAGGAHGAAQAGAAAGPWAAAGPLPETRLFRPPTRRREVEGAAAVLRHYRRRGIPYRRMAVVAGDLEAYAGIVEAVFAAADIPVFLDRERPMRPHPLVRLVEALLEGMENGPSTPALIALLKTGLLGPFFEARGMTLTEDDIDRLENWLLEYGVQGSDWAKPHFGRPPEVEAARDGGRPETAGRPAGPADGAREAGAAFAGGGPEGAGAALREKIREALAQALFPDAEERTAAEPPTAGAWARRLWRRIEALDVEAGVRRSMFAAEGRGAVEEADEDRQAWQTLIELLEQTADVLGETPMDAGTFARLFRFGLRSARFRLVPRTVEAVTVADLDRSRLLDVDVIVFLGAVRGAMPPEGGDDGWLSEAERRRLFERLAEAEAPAVRLAPPLEERVAEAAVKLWSFFAEAGRARAVFVPAAVGDEPATPAPWVEALEETSPPAAGRRIPPSLLSPTQGLQVLAAGVRAFVRGALPPPAFWPLYAAYVALEKAGDPAGLSARGIAGLAAGRPERGRIAPELARRLFPPPLIASVSKMERYHECPYAFYAAHGLALAERPVHRLTMPDVGELYHAALAAAGPALAALADRTKGAGGSWLSGGIPAEAEAALRAAVEAATAAALQQDRRALFSADARRKAIAHRLRRHVERTARAAVEQLRRGAFRPHAFEFAVGDGRDGVPLRLPGGRVIRIRGRIDRIDLAPGKAAPWLRIVDYKSRFVAPDARRFLAGVDLQLIVYLDLLLNEGLRIEGKRILPRPAAALYQIVGDPRPIVKGSEGEAEIAHLVLKAYRLSGWIARDRDAVFCLDESLPERLRAIQEQKKEKKSRRRTVDSAVLDLSLTLEGDLPAGSRGTALFLIPEAGWAALRAVAREKLEEAVVGIEAGRYPAAPFAEPDGTPVCRFCPYQAVCGFDPEAGDRPRRFYSAGDARRVLAEIVHGRAAAAEAAGRGVEAGQGGGM
ncbi:PD-(D/E)XK nuclease family protein [Hydrogenibacillus sp. N12]|uniref:PD-(D/E)XK nuclease family protein n=1 Tax=Hydrogenibacillus sp. N12 TaxID=2866627 RepID=UPI001C7D60AF|nr:PD-(D/E)XK nuclease family protein [Hydrogenibacillus sp. N12]QZA33198.1 exodeoxyribonuclease V subunit gamma [Hydrogenibacillus sp. N12]